MIVVLCTGLLPYFCSLSVNNVFKLQGWKATFVDSLFVLMPVQGTVSLCQFADVEIATAWGLLLCNKVWLKIIAVLCELVVRDLWGVGAVAMSSGLFHWELCNPVSLLPWELVLLLPAWWMHMPSQGFFPVQSVQQPWGLVRHVEYPDPLGMHVLRVVLNSASSHVLLPAGVLLRARSKHPGM